MESVYRCISYSVIENNKIIEDKFLKIFFQCNTILFMIINKSHRSFKFLNRKFDAKKLKAVGLDFGTI